MAGETSGVVCRVSSAWIARVEGAREPGFEVVVGGGEAESFFMPLVMCSMSFGRFSIVGEWRWNLEVRWFTIWMFGKCDIGAWEIHSRLFPKQRFYLTPLNARLISRLILQESIEGIRNQLTMQNDWRDTPELEICAVATLKFPADVLHLLREPIVDAFLTVPGK